MNDTFERRGLLKLLSDSLIMLIRIVDIGLIGVQRSFCTSILLLSDCSHCLQYVCSTFMCDTGPSMLDARAVNADTPDR